MRNSRLTIILVIVLLIISSCVRSSYWMGLVGRWQDTEAPSMELEFTSGGRYNEYFLDNLLGYGEFYADGDILELHYLSPCGGQSQIQCDVRLKFTVTEETLIITDAYGDLVYRKVD